MPSSQKASSRVLALDEHVAASLDPGLVSLAAPQPVAARDVAEGQRCRGAAIFARERHDAAPLRTCRMTSVVFCPTTDWSVEAAFASWLPLTQLIT
jgi:uncharacterized membrane protein